MERWIGFNAIGPHHGSRLLLRIVAVRIGAEGSWQGTNAALGWAWQGARTVVCGLGTFLAILLASGSTGRPVGLAIPYNPTGSENALQASGSPGQAVVGADRLAGGSTHAPAIGEGLRLVTGLFGV